MSLEHYKIRINIQFMPAEDRERIVQYLISHSYAYMYVTEHIDTNMQQQWYYSTMNKGKTIREYIRRYVVGNRGYSMKELSEQYPIKYLGYLYKEFDPVVYNIPEEVISQAKQYNIQVATEIAEKKKAKKPIWKQILETISPEDNEGKVLHKVLQYHLDKEILIRESALISYYDTILAHQNPIKYEQYLYHRIAQRTKFF